MADFERQSKKDMIKNSFKCDFRRMFTSPLIYIMAGISLVMPVLILVMTSMMPQTATDPETGAEVAAQTFTNVWQAIGSLSSESSATAMDLTSMCNINLLYFLLAVPVCKFIADDFRCGYAKNIFTVRPQKLSYVLSKTAAGFTCAVIMFAVYFIGAMIGGAVAGLPFDTAAGAGGIVMCMLSKIFLSLVFVAIFSIMGMVAKRRLWLSILLSLGAGMLLFTMIPMITPLDSGILNVVLCLAGGAMFAAGLGAASCVVLNKTSLV